MKLMFLGKHLLVRLPAESNGSFEAFGVVTRVWGPPEASTCVNMLIFPDGPSTQYATSVPVAADREAANKLRELNPYGFIAYHP